MILNSHTVSVMLNILLIGIVIYACLRWRKRTRPQLPVARPLARFLDKAITRVAVYLVLPGILVGLVFWVPEVTGRKDATAVCNSIAVGSRFAFDRESLEAYRMQQKPKYGTLSAASYHPKVKGGEEGTGAIILVFLAGFPFSRAYCVASLNKGAVESTRLMFNAEDYTYCNGEMRRVWECSDDRRKSP